MIFKITVIFIFGWMSAVCLANESEQNNPQMKNTPALWKLYTDALRGDKNSQFQVGVMFERGAGVEVNQTQAAKWYEKAGLQGHIDAQYNVGIMYASGRGVEQNDMFAMMWLASAAKQGDKEARKLLNKMIDNEMTVNPPQVTSQVKTTDTVLKIKAVRFETKEGASLCTVPDIHQCTAISEKKIFTSKSKQGQYYKISGIIVGHKWEDYEGDGYIDMSMVELK